MLVALMIATLFSDVSARARKKRPSPTPPGTVEIITKVNDYWQRNHSPKVRSFWDEAAYHTGNMEAYRLLGCARWLAYSDEWARHNKWMGAQEKDPAKWKYKNYGEGHDYALFGDWQICFQTYLDMYEMNPDPYKIQRAIEVMDYEVRQPETDFWWWADALYMVMPVMTKLYKATGEVKYLDKLYANYKWADDLMYDQEVHLYFRDAKYIYPKAKTRNGGKDFWARGDGWVLAGLAKVLADMPKDYKHRPFFVQRFKEMAEAVSKCQQPEGYWTRSMLDKDHAEGPETSGTAFFCYGLLWGINHGLLPAEQYESTMQKAWKYLTETALQESGAVGYVQPIGERAIPGQQLSEKNEANFGVGAFLLAACEHLRYEDGSVGRRGMAKTVSITVKNESDEFRQQVIEIDAADIFARLGIHGGRQFIVRDPAGLELPYQLSYDENILVDAGVSPHSSLTLTLEKGTPQVYKTVCYGRIYPERKDDYAWENDRGAYRVYGPALQRSGEKSYGLDVWSKNTPELVVEQRYWIEDVVMMPLVEKLRAENRQRGDSLYRINSYHHDHGRGMDLYKVGATLGCGTPAFMDGDRLVYPYCFKDYEVLDNGPLRTTVLLNYHKTPWQGDSITEHRIISLDKGSNFNKMTVWYSNLKQPVRLASGVVLHSEDKESVVLGNDHVAYADPTDNPRVNNCQVFVATLYPKGGISTRKVLFDKPFGGNEGHALGILDGYKGERFTYYFGSAWSKYDVRTMAEWEQRIDWTLRSLRHPLKVTVDEVK
jgi:rhamnogalacturonyl hydrolase YesR